MTTDESESTATLHDGTSLRRRVTFGVLWSAVQIWGARATTAVTFIVLGRNIAPASFGVVAVCAGIVTILSIISDSGLANYLVRQPSLSKITIDTAFWTTTALSVVLTLAVFLAAPLASAIFNQPELTTVLRWLSLTLILIGVSSVPNALMRKGFRFRALALRETAANVLGSAVAITMALLGFEVSALVAQALVAATVATVVLWLAVPWMPSMSFDKAESRAMLAFGGRLLGVDLLVQARDRGEEFVLAATQTSAILGFWSVSSRLVKLIQDTGTQMVSTVATSAFSEIQEDRPRLYRWYASGMAATGLLLFPALLFLAVTGPDLVPFVLGKQWTRVGGISQIVAVTAVVGVFSYFDRSVCVAVGRLKAELRLVFGIVVLHLVATLVAAPHGLKVLALALLGRALVTFPVRQVVLHRVVGVPYRCLVPAARVLAAALVTAAAIGLTKQIWPQSSDFAMLGLQFGVGVGVYPFALLLLAAPVVVELIDGVRGRAGLSSRRYGARRLFRRS